MALDPVEMGFLRSGMRRETHPNKKIRSNQKKRRIKMKEEISDPISYYFPIFPWSMVIENLRKKIIIFIGVKGDP